MKALHSSSTMLKTSQPTWSMCFTAVQNSKTLESPTNQLYNHKSSWSHTTSSMFRNHIRIDYTSSDTKLLNSHWDIDFCSVDCKLQHNHRLNRASRTTPKSTERRIFKYRTQSDLTNRLLGSIPTHLSYAVSFQTQYTWPNNLSN